MYFNRGESYNLYSHVAIVRGGGGGGIKICSCLSIRVHLNHIPGCIWKLRHISGQKVTDSVSATIVSYKFDILISDDRSNELSFLFFSL